MIAVIIGLCFVNYIIGSIPFGALISNYFGIDITKHGSGGTGATNVSRTLGREFGFAVFLLDGLKGALCYELNYFILQNRDYAAVISVIAIIGHSYSIYLTFNGGKGVSTAFFLYLAVDYRIFLITSIFWLLSFKITRYVSLSSMLAIISAGIFCLFGVNSSHQIMTVSIAVLVVCRHQQNIMRLLVGQEGKF